MQHSSRPKCLQWFGFKKDSSREERRVFFISGLLIAKMDGLHYTPTLQSPRVLGGEAPTLYYVIAHSILKQREIVLLGIGKHVSSQMGSMATQFFSE